MEDNNNKFNSKDGTDPSNTDVNNNNLEDAESGPKEERTSYYYSYGPFKSNLQEGEVVPSTEQHVIEAERIDPEPIRGMELETATRANADMASSSVGTWEYKTPRKSRFRSLFAAFMSGAIVLGSFMFASDRMNLFTFDEGVLGAANNITAEQPVSTNNNYSPINAALYLDRPGNIAEIFTKSSPAVVKIETFVKPSTSRSRGGLLDDPFFRQFFGDDSGSTGDEQGQQQNDGKLEAAGMGSGFIFDKTGYILTNQHVIGDSPEEIQVTVEGHKKPYKAKLLGSSYDLDLAVLKIEGAEFPILPLGKSDKISIGDWTIAIGNPYGFDHTVTVGVLSAKERPITIPDTQGDRNYKNLLQTDTAINPGNSGGPLLNLNGEVIGINTAVSAQAQGIGFAIPTSTIESVLEQLKSNKEIPKAPIPFVGINLSDIKETWLKELGLKSTAGSMVMSVPFNTPAYEADIRQYDVITAVDGKKVANSAELKAAIEKHKVGDSVKLTLVRNGKSIEVIVKVGDRNEYEKRQLQ